MNYTLFSEDMKLNDLELANGWLLYVLAHFSIELGFGEKTVKQVCKYYKIDVQLFVLVCNLYTFDDYQPQSSDIDKELAKDIISYLEFSHRDYRQHRIPKIISQIETLEEHYHCDVLTTYCKKFSEDINDHFEYEETIVFPSILNLIYGNKTLGFKIDKFKLENLTVNVKYYMGI